MNAPLAKEQITLLMSNTVSYPDAAVQGTRSHPTGLALLAQRVKDAVRFVAELPQRRAVIDELSRLSDRELADIGLNRASLSEVFSREPR